MLTGNVRREAVGVIRLVRGVALPEESYAVEQPNEADVSDECEKTFECARSGSRALENI